MLVEGNYLVLYENHPDLDEGPVDWVEIVSVVDGRRDLSELFSQPQIEPINSRLRDAEQDYRERIEV